VYGVGIKEGVYELRRTQLSERRTQNRTSP